MKKKILYALLAVIMLIPTFVAVRSYLSEKNAPAGEKNIISLSIKDSEQNVYELNRSRDGEEVEKLINIIKAIEAGGTKVSSIPTSVEMSDPFLITLVTPVKSTSYQFYFDTDASNCYYSLDGMSFRIKAEDAGRFLSTEYAECLYIGANVPTLTVSGANTVSPSNLRWFYRNYRGELTEKNGTDAYLGNGPQHVDLIGAVALNFSIEPDIYTLNITDSDGKVISAGENRTPVMFDKDTYVDVTVEAKWFESEEKSYSGEAAYSFSATVSAPPTFHLAADSVQESKFVTVTAIDAKDASMISFSSEPELGSSPVFYSDGSDSYGILPIPSGSEGEYTLTFIYGGAAAQLDLTVTPFKAWYGTDELKEITYSPEVFAASYSEEARAEFDALVKELCESEDAAAAAGTKYFDGYFLGPREQYGGYGSGRILYGEKISIAGNQDDSMTFVSEGLDQIYSGDVPAAAAGKVVYTGSTAYSGNIVVIEHGWGLKTWYWCLGEVSVNVGDVLERGTVIGRTGTTGFSTGSEGVHLAMSVGSTFVCPYDTWSDADGEFRDGVLVYTE